MSGLGISSWKLKIKKNAAITSGVNSNTYLRHWQVVALLLYLAKVISVRVVITMPVYEDWESAALLCRAIDAELAHLPGIQASIIMTDDGSRTKIGNHFALADYEHVNTIRLLRLRRNLGHQRAIAVALAFIQQNVPCDAVIVMDADGEDRPSDIPRLIDAFRASNSAETIFVERGRRIESLAFKTYYQIYRFFHFLLTGRGIRFGNFSLIPAEHLASIVAFPELWNHYAAAVLRSRLPYSTIRGDRAYRLRGESRMNFVSLFIHGLSALFASYEIVSTRLRSPSLISRLVAGLSAPRHCCWS